jgi:hypothetical protein
MFLQSSAEFIFKPPKSQAGQKYCGSSKPKQQQQFVEGIIHHLFASGLSLSVKRNHFGSVAISVIF